MFEPAAEKEIAALNSKGYVRARTLNRFANARHQFRRHSFVGVNVKDPGVLERDILQSPILVRRPVVKGALRNLSSRRLRDLNRPIRAIGIVNVDIVRLAHRLQAAGQILFLILSENENGNHERELRQKKTLSDALPFSS